MTPFLYSLDQVQAATSYLHSIGKWDAKKMVVIPPSQKWRAIISLANKFINQTNQESNGTENAQGIQGINQTKP